MTTNTGKRVVVTQTGNTHKGLKGTVVAENKFSYMVRVDGKNHQGVWLRKPTMPNAGCKHLRGRRPKNS